MARLPTLSPTRRLHVVAAISSFLNLIMIYVNLGMGLAELIEKRKSNPRLGRQPMDTDLVRHYDRQRHLELAIRRSDTYAYDRVRMNRTLFNSFCHLLITEGGLKRTRNVDIDEMVYTFLRTISHNEKNRTLILNLRRSGETISRSIHRVLRAVIRLNDMLMKKPVPIPENSTDSRWKYFKSCLGALDGTHVRVRPLKEDRSRYRDREGKLSMNVLGVCTPNLEFIYCLSGWEGSAHDGRVLRDALTRQNCFTVPQGCYYLCDAGYANSPGFLTPYRGQRYHLKEWGVNPPETAEEFYNMKHSSARNVIERIFGILKMRWAILRDSSWFAPREVARIVVACCIIHNFIKREQGADQFERTYQDEEPEHHPSTEVETIDTCSMHPCPEWTQYRNQIAISMWENRPNR
ncbi:unnamed protein product [Linum tenue]|uniref:DDE Tnp4 domain-containing protein n=1 Tax=Linum tenue TaxID=586396 RepID=A0AAV0HT74_9ROSI|nr:unnamed protein product [Linum tenue]